MKSAGIVTLTTDFGLTDPYVAMMKGVIYSINPDARLVDITHQVRAGDVFHGAGLINETFGFFPMGTVHVAVVDPGVGSNRRPLGLESEGHFFIGPDNGLFWPVMEDHQVTRLIHLTEERYFLHPVSHTFHGREIFAPAAAHLSLGADLGLMGHALLNPARLDLPRPKKRGDTLHGEVIRVDNFGNLITNISRGELALFIQSARPVIKLGALVIENVGQTYADMEKGEILALINSSGLLEIAVNQGRASDQTGLDQARNVGTDVKVIKKE